MSRFVLRSATEPARDHTRRFAPHAVAGILLVIAALLLVFSTAAFRGNALAVGGTPEAPASALAAAKNDGKGGGGKAQTKKDNGGTSSGKATVRELRSASVEELCGELPGTIVNGMPVCTHGDDPPPTGLDPRVGVEPVRRAAIVPRATCIDDGQSGYRVQVLYVYPTDAVPGNRIGTYRDSIRTWVSDMNQIFENSAQLTGGHRQVRLVTDSACQPVVTPVGLPAATLSDFGRTMSALSGQGYNRTDRNYLLFADAQVYCGIGTVRGDDRRGQDNPNNVGGGYARVDSGCWSGSTAAHEVMHNLGGVQLTAPNTTGGFHCTDERDLMCYQDGPSSPNVRTVCTTGVWATLDLFDCGQDDYFSANPGPGTYLSRFWNTADSRFLTSAAKPIAIAPASGPVGTELTVSLNGFPAGQDISITFDGRPIGTGKVDPNGSASVTAKVPAATTGNHEVYARTGSRSESVDFRVSPAISTTGKVKKNGKSKVTVTGFGASERVDVKRGARTLKTVTVDSAGSATTTVKVGARKGKTTLTAVGASKNSAETSLTLRGKSKKGKNGTATSALVETESATDVGTTGDRDAGRRDAAQTGNHDGDGGGKQGAGRGDRK